jgi:hypothetical protein
MFNSSSFQVQNECGGEILHLSLRCESIRVGWEAFRRLSSDQHVENHTFNVANFWLVSKLWKLFVEVALFAYCASSGLSAVQKSLKRKGRKEKIRKGRRGMVPGN